MSGPVVSAGSRIFISADNAGANLAANFEVLAWTQINGVRLAGELGNIWNTRDEFLIDSDFIIKKKTGISLNTMPLEVFTLSGDAGQFLLRSASAINDSYSFKVERKDGGIRYFTGQVTRYIEGQGGNGKDLFDAVCAIEPQNSIVFV